MENRFRQKKPGAGHCQEAVIPTRRSVARTLNASSMPARITDIYLLSCKPFGLILTGTQET